MCTLIAPGFEGAGIGHEQELWGCPEDPLRGSQKDQNEEARVLGQWVCLCPSLIPYETDNFLPEI